MVGYDNLSHHPRHLRRSHRYHFRNDKYPDWAECYYGVYYWVYATWKAAGDDDV